MPNPLIFSPDQLAPGKAPAFDGHIHTIWTDGELPVAGVYAQAVDCGLEAILFSEHARKTSTDWFNDFAAEVRALPTSPCRAFVGVECKVEDFDGTLDTAPEIYDLCDLVMASVHRFPDGKGGAYAFDAVPPEQAVELEFRLSMAALSNPLTDVLGHPFGMSYKRFKTAPGEDLLRELCAAAAKNQVAIEINSAYHPDPWRLIDLCRDAGVQISLGSNAHQQHEIGQIVRLLNKTEQA